MRPTTQRTGRSSDAWKFVVTIGVLSLFADFTYEGSRSIVGPFLATLNASAAVVGVVTGFGELVGYGLRLVSGGLADRTGRFWPIAMLGYVVQMCAVPALALAGNWQTAAALIILERTGKAIRNPPRDTMLAHAAQQIGYGRAFGLHEALDQTGALIGPLAVAGVYALYGDYRHAFAALLLPALICLGLLMLARHFYPHPEMMEDEAPASKVAGRRYPRAFWIYLAGAGLVAAGFADFPLIAYHFEKTGTLSTTWIPIAYAVAMAVSGSGSLLFGQLFDRVGMRLLIPLTLVGAAFAPLVFYGGSAAALAGAALWGLGMGVHESLIPAAVGPMVSPQHRASAYGLFTAGYGVCWFAGSAVIGILYDHSRAATVAFCMLLQCAAIPFFLAACRKASADNA